MYKDFEVIKQHPFKSYIPLNAKFLVIGTFLV